MKPKARKQDTMVVTAGRHPEDHHARVNPAVYHVSTVLYPTVADLEAGERPSEARRITYGRSGTPTTFALEDAVAALEGGHACQSFPSGLSAVSSALLAFLDAGDRLLMVDSAYEPTRRFCEGVLRRMGIETVYYDPLIGGAIGEIVTPNTKVVFVESPGSLTFEVQDVPAIAAAAHGHGATVIMDNTWASPLYFKPLRPRRRHLDPGGDQVHRRPRRRHAWAPRPPPRRRGRRCAAPPAISAPTPRPTIVISASGDCERCR